MNTSTKDNSNDINQASFYTINNPKTAKLSQEKHSKKGRYPFNINKSGSRS